MTKREQLIFNRQEEDAYARLVEEGCLSDEECAEQAHDEAEASYDDYGDMKHEEAREARWEREDES